MDVLLDSLCGTVLNKTMSLSLKFLVVTIRFLRQLVCGVSARGSQLARSFSVRRLQTIFHRYGRLLLSEKR